MSTFMMLQPAIRSGAVTKSDTTILKFKSLWIGGAGNVAIQHAIDGAGTTTVFTGVLAGTLLPVEGVRVMSTNTTATNIVWLDW